MTLTKNDILEAREWVRNCNVDWFSGNQHEFLEVRESFAKKLDAAAQNFPDAS